MSRHVALLRGINVGRAKRVAMADLRAVVESLGYQEVSTLLNSGNVVFSAPRVTSHAAAARIEKALAGQLGISARVIGLSAAELDAIIQENSLLEIADHLPRLMVAVFAGAGDGARLKPLLKENWSPEALATGPRAAYLWCPAGQLESPLFAAVGRVLGDAVTTRNWVTMTKLHALARLKGSSFLE